MSNLMITKKQLKLFKFIKGYVQKEEVPTTVRECATHMECVHSNVHRMLRLLERANLIKVYPAKPRGREIVQ